MLEMLGLLLVYCLIMFLIRFTNFLGKWSDRALTFAAVAGAITLWQKNRADKSAAVTDGTQGPNRLGPDSKVALSAAQTASVPGGWFADPTGRHELRFWDSVRWTAAVADNGVTSADEV